MIIVACAAAKPSARSDAAAAVVFTVCSCLLVLVLFVCQDVDKMRHAVGLKAYSSQQPLDEFRLEANRAFLLLLDTYRDAVVARLMVPDLNFSLLLGQQQEELLAADMGAADALQQQAQQQQQQTEQAHLQGMQESSNGHASGQQGLHGSSHQATLGSQAGMPNGHQQQQHGGQNDRERAHQQDDLQPAATSAGQSSSS